MIEVGSPVAFVLGLIGLQRDSHKRAATIALMVSGPMTALLVFAFAFALCY